MNTLNKSELLAKYMGWSITPNGYCVTETGETFDMHRYDLYRPRRMQWAWAVLQTAYQSDLHDALNQFLTDNHWGIFGAKAEKAQAKWLDFILENCGVQQAKPNCPACNGTGRVEVWHEEEVWGQYRSLFQGAYTCSCTTEHEGGI